MSTHSHVLRHVMSVVSGLGTRLASTCLPTKRNVFKRGMEEETLELFQSIGLSENKAKETAKNGVVSATLKALIVQVGTVDIGESVDSLCRDGADAQYIQYLSKSRITSPQIP